MAAGQGFVGRSSELTHLLGALDRATEARAQGATQGWATTVLVAGEAGIGKTRLLEELGRLASERSVPVLWGRATHEAGAPAFWPWRQVLRTWVAGTDPDAARALLGEGADGLARIAPELRALGPAADVTAVSASGAAGAEQRFALFEQVRTFLTGVAAERGLVLVLDDLHWADTASLRLLAHLTREVGDARLLVAGAFRPLDADQAGEPGEVVAEVSRQRSAVRLDLAGMADGEVGEQLAQVLGRPPDPDEVETIVRRTAGNPLFVQEVGRLLTARSASDSSAGHGEADLDGRIPDAVRSAIGERLAYLPVDSRAMLAQASVLGVDIDLRLLAKVADLTIDGVLSHLDDALATGVVTQARSAARYRFAHDLVRECLDLDNTPRDRARLHLRAAEHLAGRLDDAYLSEIAHHRLEALPLGDAEAAVRAGCDAARLAMDQLAFEDAARLYAWALSAAPAIDLGAAARCRLLVEMARARLLAHDVGAAMAVCEQAADLAVRTHDVEALGEAALVLQEIAQPDWNAKVQAWCRRALAGLPIGDSPLRAKLLAQHAIARMDEIESPAVAAAGAEALAMAERLNDPGALLAALRARQLARSSPDGVTERLGLADRMARLGARTHDDGALQWGHLWRFDALVQLGRIDEAEDELDQFASVVRRMRQPLARWHLLRSRAAIHLGRGRFHEALAATREATAEAERGQHASALSAAAVKLVIAVLTGDPEVAADVPPLPDDLPPPIAPVARLSYAEWHLAFGRRDEAKRLYLLLPPPTWRPPPWLRPNVAAYRGMIAATLGDRAGADAAYESLLPAADVHVASGAGAVLTRGSTQHHLGVAAAGCGRTEVAIDHLRAAITANRTAGLPPCAAEATCRLAEILRERDHPGDHQEAASLADEVQDAADRLGMAPVADRARAVLAGLPDHGPDDPLSPREREIAALVAQGLTNRQIAETAHISERTAENHVQHILTKLGFNTRSQIASWVTARRWPTGR
jgi:DNA-binding CsgD family transcriptional regulator/tetratricopeptide (TPR) repeat protein